MSKKILSSREGMTADWFTSMLQDAGALKSGRVENVELEPFGGGVMTNMVRATLHYTAAENAPSSLLVKYPSDDEGSRGVAQLMGLYELEVCFYRDMAALLPGLRLPRCYLAEIEEASGRFTLVLEDCSADTKPGTMLSTLSPAECSAALGELANFQAPLWNAPALSDVPWLNNPVRTLAIFDAIPAGLAPFLARFGNALDPDHVKMFEAVLPLAGKWARSWQPPKVLQHGEFRSGNILLGVNAGAPAVTMIDFQTVRVGPPGIDAAYFMGGSMPAEDRRRMERDVIRDYHACLLGAGVEGFNWDACWKSYREGAMYGVYLLVGMAGQVESSERNDRIILGLTRQLATMAIDLEAPKAAGML